MRPLKQMLSKINLNSNRTKKNLHKNKLALSVAQLITKLIVLTSIAVITNLFGGIWFAVTDIALFSYIDTLINPLCLVLMEVSNKDLYRKCCKYCHIGMHKLVHSKNESIKSRPFADLIVEKEDNTKNSDGRDVRVNSDSNTNHGENDNNNNGKRNGKGLVMKKIDTSINVSSGTESKNTTPIPVERVNSVSEYDPSPSGVTPAPLHEDVPTVMKMTKVMAQPETPQSTRL